MSNSGNPRDKIHGFATLCEIGDILRSNRMRNQKFASLLVIYAILTSLLAPFVHTQTPTPTPVPESKKGLQFRLSEPDLFQVQDGPGLRRPQAEVTSLSAGEAGEIFRRLPPMAEDAADRSEFNLRADSLPPPKTGDIIQTAFPVASDREAPAAPQPAAAALEVMRYSPSGEVGVVPELSVTFSQPMVAVTSQAIASETVPVILTPSVKGKWRWLGTNTLIFDAETRFPMATTFSARVPAGTRSPSGTTLKNDVAWSFSTNPPKVTEFKPIRDDAPPDTVMLAAFDQGVSAEAMLAKIVVAADGKRVPLRLASSEELARDKYLSDTAKGFQPGRWVAFRAVEGLPLNARITVSFEPGLPSAEGPRVTTRGQTHLFKTYAPFKFVKSGCGYGSTPWRCGPGALSMEFNNNLDEKAFDPSMVRIDPAVEGAEIEADGNSITISGAFLRRTTYEITVSGGIKDVYTQRLGHNISERFTTAPEEPSLHGWNLRGRLTVLDPNAKPRVSVLSTNFRRLKVSLYAVKPEDYPAYLDWLDDTRAKPAFGRPVIDKVLNIKAKPDETIETWIDATAALSGGLGHAVLIVEAPDRQPHDDGGPIVTWLEATQIGLDALSDSEKMSVYASALKNGKPLPGVQVSLSGGIAGITSENGLARLPLPTSKSKGLLIARLGADTAILEDGGDSDNESDWISSLQADTLRWFVFNDRNMYQPGETVSIKGYIRKVTGGVFTDIADPAGAASGVSYVLKDPLGNEVLKGRAEISSFGAFDLKLKIPENINLGDQDLTFEVTGGLVSEDATHSFQVQEFRRPEFEVSATAATPGPYYVGLSSPVIQTEAKYYAGGALSDAETNWNVSARPASYSPPGFDDYTFGKFIPWWRSYYRSDYNEWTSQQFKGKTGPDGKHRVKIDIDSADPSRPYTVTAEARVQDVNRQVLAATASILVHSSRYYVGIRTPKTFVVAGEKFRLETVTTDVEGGRMPNVPVAIAAVLTDWQKVKGDWQEVTVDEQKCESVSGPTGEAGCDITAKKGGVYTITAIVADSNGKRNESEMTVWVAGGGREPEREVEEEDVELIPGKKEYSPGDTAEILVNAPFFPAEGVLTLDRNGIVSTERFTMNEASTILRIPIEERYLPNLHVRVDLTGTAPRIYYEDERDEKLPKRPAYASGTIEMRISTASRKLNVTAEPADKILEPGGKTRVNVAITDNNGRPVGGSEVALVVVDESILALTSYSIPDPLEAFYKEIEAGTSAYHSRAGLRLADPEREGGAGYGVGYGSGSGSGDGSGSGVGGGGGGRSTYVLTGSISSKDPYSKPGYGRVPDQIKIRSNFNALAIFSPSVVTGADGRAVIEVPLPDNLTRYRVTAVAAANAKQFGTGESNITARQPLMLRPSAPRFMNFGDRAELPMVVQNQTDEPVTVNVAIRAANAKLAEGNGRKAYIPANGRVELRFPVEAEKAGTARFQVGAVSGSYADAAEFGFPVYTPASSEAFATYGTMDKNGAIAQPVEAPGDAFSEFGGLEVTTSSTQLQELTDAFIYLQSYPYECTEQISSRILSVAALRDTLAAFNAKGLPTPAEIEAKMRSDIERIEKLQHKDGGFSFWRSDDASLPFLSVHVAHALARAREKGYTVSPGAIKGAAYYLKHIEGDYPGHYSGETRRAISAYALYVRDLLSDKDTGKARELLRNAGTEKLWPETLGWLMSVMAGDKGSAAEIETIKRQLLNSVTETAGAAHFVTEYGDGSYILLSSDRRSDGVVLDALLKADPASDLIPKIVRGLLDHRKAGRWGNTQENAFNLLALDRYFHTYEKVTPNFVARVWLGSTYAGEQKYAGRSVDSNRVTIPMEYLQRQSGAQNLTIDRQGEGRLYYRIGMNYAPKSLRQDAADYGFTVMRRYEGIDDPADVRQDPDGTWIVRSGARIRVTVQMIAPGPRYHVALVDRLPAGFEIINTDLATSEKAPVMPASDRSYSYYWKWFQHENLRDDRAEAFTMSLNAGAWTYTYLVRATTPGDFVAPPAKAEEMYAPETFGRSKSEMVRVE